MIRHDNEVVKFEARNWMDFLRKIDHIIRHETIKFPLGEDDDMEMVEKEITKIDKFN